MAAWPDVETRFWSKVEVGLPEQCWEWRGTRHKRGYGVFKVGLKRLRSSRGAEPGWRRLMERPFDHGELNTPLRKRQANIDAQIDAYKATQAKVVEQRLRVGRQQVREARDLVRKVGDGRMAELGAACGITGKQARKHFLSVASSNPALILKTMAKEA